MTKRREQRLIDMNVEEQTQAIFQHVFSGLVRDGLTGMKDATREIVLTLDNQRTEDAQVKRKGKRSRPFIS